MMVLFSFLFTFRLSVKDFSLMTVCFAASRLTDVAPARDGNNPCLGPLGFVTGFSFGFSTVLLGMLNGFTSRFNLNPNLVNPGRKDSRVGNFLVGVSVFSLGLANSLLFFGDSVLSGN